jgi:predicted O-methyltransferase YrrM
MLPKKYSDKLLPNQKFFSNLYRDSAPFESALYALMSSYTREFDSSRFDLATPKAIDFEEMSTPPWQLVFFETVIGLTGAKTVLEIGTFIGHSTMQFALMVGEKGHVTTIEVGKEFAEIARGNFRRNGFDKRITLHEGDAGKILKDLPPSSFDFIFVDGSKQDYLEYTIKSEKLLSPSGVIIVDDVFFHGDALNAEPSTDKGRGCKQLLDHYKSHKEIQRMLLPMANGILLLYKKREVQPGR